MNRIQKALVVDDSKLARLTLARLLKSKEIKVIEADSVDNALRVLHSESVDAIFLDVQMPEKNGFEGLKILKQDPTLKDIPCSMYSGDLSVDAQQEAISNGAQAYLFKPADEESLDHVLEALASNLAHEEVQPYTETVVDSHNSAEMAESAQKIFKHRKALMTLDGRTRNLARLLNQEKQETGSAVNQLNEQITQVSKELDSLKKQNEYSMHDDLFHKRAENDIRGQLQKTRDNLRMATMVAIIASVIAVFSLILTIVIYFNYLS